MKEYDEKASGYFEFDRQDILPYLPAAADRICEIGCGTGKTLASIKRKYQAGLAVGFDIHEESIATARTRLDKAEVIDVEAANLPEYVHDMDVFLCLDVLEHLRDPWSVIKKLHARLRPGGCIVASIPNIRHYTVSLNLLFAGQWELQDAGLLDRTHLRFFVRKTALELMSSSGLRVDAVGVNYRRRRDRAAAVVTGGVLRDLFALQYVIRATKL